MNYICNRILVLSIGLLVILMVANASILAQDASVEPQVSSAEIFWVRDDIVVETAVSTLTRMEHGIFMTFYTTDLTLGDAYTGWWLIFNNPESCSDNHCGFDDVILVDQNDNPILDADGNQRPNRTGRAASQVSLLRATHGLVDEDGSLDMKAHLPIGDTTEAVWGPGLTDSVDAEIHVIIRSHGPAIPGMLAEQFLTPWGGCPDSPPRDPCADMVQAAVHQSVHNR